MNLRTASGGYLPFDGEVLPRAYNGMTAFALTPVLPGATLTGRYPPNCDVHPEKRNVRFTSIRDDQSLATNVPNPPEPAEPLSIGTYVWYHDTT